MAVGEQTGHRHTMNEDISRSVQVCIPWRLLKDRYLPKVLANRMNPEIGISGDVIDSYTKEAFYEVASLLQNEGLTISLHAPFYDLAPGGVDRKILKATRERLQQLFDLVPLFKPVSVVCHTGYDRKRYHEVEDAWLETSLETWTTLAGHLKGTETTLMIENVYEKSPRMLVRLFDRLDTEQVGFCFDTGHMHAFSKTDMRGWLNKLGPRIKELHLHDNDGSEDHHLAIGEGDIDFEPLFEYVDQKGLKPIITIEAHKEKWLWQSIEALSRSECFRRIIGL
jgi:sugar phosphate isomerase/epimerase